MPFSSISATCRASRDGRVSERNFRWVSEFFILLKKYLSSICLLLRIYRISLPFRQKLPKIVPVMLYLSVFCLSFCFSSVTFVFLAKVGICFWYTYLLINFESSAIFIDLSFLQVTRIGLMNLTSSQFSNFYFVFIFRLL